ncbi:MAG: HD domain-containing protein [Bdellovibrionaceae bacterium]|nr:HD domain-containing protein [Bdellovibrio sp.]
MSSEATLTPIRSLVDKEAIVDRPFLVKDKVKGMGKNGRAFLSLLIGDKTGHIDARVWDRVEEMADTFDIGDIILVKGQVQLYLNRKQIIVHKVEKAEENAFNKEEFSIEDKKIDAHALYSELIQIVQQIETVPIRQLILDSLQDEEIKPLILKAPAAKTIHHAHRGGLLEHVVSICKLMKMMAAHYSYMDVDLLLFGAIFHDLGKVWELDIQREQIQYSHKGRLLGHMQLACELIDKKAQRILGFPEDLREVMKHIVLSHHGKLEYGSPVRPYFMEAMMVAMIDDLDSKVDTVQNFIESERQTGESWSRYNDNFDRYFYLENLKGRWK